MNTNQTIRDLTIAYIENALTEVALLHDLALIDPTLKRFHIERQHELPWRAPKGVKFISRGGLKPRPVYSVTDGRGAPLGDPIHEGDLGSRYAENIIEQQIAANLEAMLTDHADLVALHRAGDGGAAPSFRYRPATSLAERTETEAALEQQKIALRESIKQLHEQREFEQRRLRSILHEKEAAEMELAENGRQLRRQRDQMREAQRAPDRAARRRQLSEFMQEDNPSHGADAPKDDGRAFG